MELNKICEKIKERRKELNLTQKDLADALHVSDKLVSKWETGESVPLLEYLQPLSEVLQISVQELMSLDTEQPTAEQSAAGQSVTEQPASVKPKKENKAKNFWNKNRKPILISIISVAAALLLTAVVLLSVFVFVPLANKKKYLEAIDNGIDRYLERGYFNICQTEEMDGDEDEYPAILQGYIDERGNVAYYNSKTYEIVKDGYKTSSVEWMSDGKIYEYVKPANINTVADLLEEQLQSWGGDDDDLFDIEEYVKYIRKTSYGYYMEFKKEFFTEDLKPSELKNLKFTDKIKGKVEMDGKVTKSITVTIKCRNTKENEDFTAVTKIEFLQTKPVIEHLYFVQPTTVKLADANRFIELMNGEALQESAGSDVFTHIVNNSTTYKNGYLYDCTSGWIEFYDTQTLSKLDKEVYIGERPETAIIYNNCIWYVPRDTKNALKRYDMSTKQTTTVLEFASGNSDFNSKYFFYVGSSSEQGFVYDMQQQKKIATAKTVLHVDLEGNIYCKRDDGTLYFYGSNKTVKGDRMFNEEGNYVYTCDSEHIYRYKGQALDKTANLSPEDAVVQSGCCYKQETSVLHDLNTGKVITLSPISIKLDDGSYALRYPQIIAVCNKYAIVSFSKKSNDQHFGNDYVGVYSIGVDGSAKLISYIKSTAYTAHVRTIGGYTFCAILDMGSIPYFKIK